MILLVTMTFVCSGFSAHAYNLNPYNLKCSSGISYMVSPNLGRFFEDIWFKSEKKIELAWLPVDPKNGLPYGDTAPELVNFKQEFLKFIQRVKADQSIQYVGHNFYPNSSSAFLAFRSADRKSVRSLICAFPWMTLFYGGYEDEAKVENPEVSK